MLDERKIVLEMRRRMLVATGIDPETQLMTSNYDFPANATLMVCEFSFGGEETLVSSMRTRISGFILEYDIYVPRNSGIGEAGRIVNAIKREFDLADNSRRVVRGDGFEAIVKTMRQESDHDDHWHRTQLIITLDAYGAG